MILFFLRNLSCAQFWRYKSILNIRLSWRKEGLLPRYILNLLKVSICPFIGALASVSWLFGKFLLWFLFWHSFVFQIDLSSFNFCSSMPVCEMFYSLLLFFIQRWLLERLNKWILTNSNIFNLHINLIILSLCLFKYRKVLFMSSHVSLYRFCAFFHWIFLNWSSDRWKRRRHYI